MQLRHRHVSGKDRLSSARRYQEEPFHHSKRGMLLTYLSSMDRAQGHEEQLTRTRCHSVGDVLCHLEKNMRPSPPKKTVLAGRDKKAFNRWSKCRSRTNHHVTSQQWASPSHELDYIVHQHSRYIHRMPRQWVASTFASRWAWKTARIKAWK